MPRPRRPEPSCWARTEWGKTQQIQEREWFQLKNMWKALGTLLDCWCGGLEVEVVQNFKMEHHYRRPALGWMATTWTPAQPDTVGIFPPSRTPASDDSMIHELAHQYKLTIRNRKMKKITSDYQSEARLFLHLRGEDDEEGDEEGEGLPIEHTDAGDETVPAPELAKMVMSTCSLTLNGPELSVNSHGRPGKKTLSGSATAMRRPSGTTAICAEMAVMVSGSFRYQKNWLRKESTAHDAVPSTHILNVSTGVSGSSLTGTVSATCSTGEFSSSPFSGELPDVDGRTVHEHHQ
uniref:Uncharacterized protein n=1 Tax=Oryza punctata TaxID=4537 RepID=A0A0E0L770_ORYPU